MKKFLKSITILMLLLSACFFDVPTVNAAYTKMWWEYLDEYMTPDKVYINTNNVLCISEFDTGFLTPNTTTEVLHNVKDFCISNIYNTKAVLMLDGTLYCWGDAVLGYDGPFDEIKIPQVVLNDVVSIDCGVDHIGALTADGTLRVWGYNMFYDYFYTRMNIDDFEVADVKQFEIDRYSFAVLKNDGTLWILGYWSKDKGGFDPGGIYKQWHLVDTNVKYIDADSGNLAYVKNNGDLMMMGSNYYGEMATPRALLEYTFNPIKIAENVEKVSLSMGDTMFLKTDGSVYSVGYTVESDVPQYIADSIIVIDSPYMWKRDGTLLKHIRSGGYRDAPKTTSNNIVVKSKIDIKPNDIYMPIVVTYNGKNIEFADQQPVIENGRTLVPVRTIFEALDATVDWEEETQTVTSIKGEKIIKLQIGSNKMYVQGAEKILDVPAKIINGRTMVPARAIAEAFDYMVSWDDVNKTVIITQ